jgi:hypothetical protein
MAEVPPNRQPYVRRFRALRRMVNEGFGHRYRHFRIEGVTMAKQKLRRIDVRRRETGWVAVEKGGPAMVEARTKADAVKKAAAAVRKTGQPTTLRIHDKNGRFQEERTYPRSADPRASKG